MSDLISIAIDGPAASGKTTLSISLAEALGYLYFDTGAMYRAVTLAALQQNEKIEDEAAVVKLAEESDIDLRPASKEDGRLYDVFLNQEDCTWAIRSEEVEANVSRVSAYPGVRAALTKQQRRIGQRGGVVMAGRDIGTVVLPDAGLKIFLVASLEVRAQRRHKELLERGEDVDYATVEADLRRRDEIDANRAVAPLCAAEDAVVIDSDHMDAQEVTARVIALAHERMAA